MIALSMIVKGTEDQAQIDRLLRSVAPHVDKIFVTATWEKAGQAVKVFEAYGAEVSFFPWEKDFAKARNFALDQIPKEYTYILWLDADDVLQGGEHLKALPAKGMDAYFFDYNYQIDKTTGQVLIKHPRERLVRNGAYRWEGKLHETLIPQRKTETAFIQDIAVNHYPTDTQVAENIRRNIEILEKTYAEEKTHDPRTEYYLARCYFDDRQFAKAEKLFFDYLEHSGWDEERAFAWNYLGEIYRISEKYEDALSSYLNALKERPEFPTFYINLGVTYGKQEIWNKALFWTQQGLSLPQPKTAMVTMPRDDKVRALETIYFACLKTNRLEEARLAAEKLEAFFPEEKLFQERREGIAELCRIGEMGKLFLQLIRAYGKETEDIVALLNHPPRELEDTQLLAKLRQQFAPAKTWPEKSIVYFCGKGFEPWDATSLANGIGGSETAVIQLTKAWAKLGYQVTVFGDPKTEYEAEGVAWKPYWKWNPLDTFDTLIIWRNESVLNTPCKARRVFLDLHDVPEAAEYTAERLKKVDRIFVKSPYHRSLLPDVPDEKFVIIPNGIDLAMLPEKLEKKGVQLIYASSYDRGLEQALSLGWPLIKQAVPEAVLHIAYGWNLYDTVHKNNPERRSWKKKMEALMAQEGIIHHGRLPQSELLALKAECQVHYYPTTFQEIDCISVRESAAVGCIPFTTDYAALKGRAYCVTTEGNPYAKETQTAIAHKVIEFLKGKMGVKSDEFHSLARKESWENIAARWLKEL